MEDPSALTDPRQSGAFDHSLGDSFEAVVRRYTGRPAVISANWQASYKELNAVANWLAHRLLEFGGDGDRVAVLMEHGGPANAAAVGILKAGRIVFAISPSDPVERLKALIVDGDPAAIVADPQNIQAARRLAPKGCELIEFSPARLTGREDNPAHAVDPGAVSFLVYTSGSTGRPKAVMKTHRQILRTSAVHTEAMGYVETDRISCFATLGSGQGANAPWWALLNGAATLPFPVRSRGITGLADWIRTQRVTVLVASASIFRTLMASLQPGEVFADVRAVRLASEAASDEDFRAFQAHFSPTSIFVHTLSSSETSNIAWSRWSHGDTVPPGILPVGRISQDQHVQLVGEDGKPVGTGETGEIVVKTRYGAAGYWRDPALSAERFSEDLDGAGTRLIRTGDLARMDADGQLRLVGRKDDRIKIRGNRVELREVELAVRRLPGLGDACVMAIERPPHEPLLTAFVVPESGARPEPEELRHLLEASLPHFMVPSKFVLLDRMPVGRGGKIDREALRAIHLAAPRRDRPEQPITAMERLIADIWSAALDVDGVGRSDDFFSLGGDSLKAAIVSAEIHATLQIEVSLGEFTSRPVLSRFAARIESLQDRAHEVVAPITPVPRRPAMPLSLFQERVWKAYQSAHNRGGFTEARILRVEGPLDADLLRRCLDELVRRHEVLRTTVEDRDGEGVQIIHDIETAAFTPIDVSQSDDPEAQARAFIEDRCTTPLDAGRLPASRYFLIRLAPREHWLFKMFMPLFEDGWSGNLLLSELAALYAAKLRGREAPLPARASLQYADFAVWQRELMRPGSPTRSSTLAWWEQRVAGLPELKDLPFARTEPLRGLARGEGIIPWQVSASTAEHLAGVARRTGATYFVLRLAAFVALVCDITQTRAAVIGTNFVHRNREDTKAIVGSFLNLAPLVFELDETVTFTDWLSVVQSVVSETESRAMIPFEQLCDHMREAGLPTPYVRMIFAMSSDHTERRFAGLRVNSLAWPITAMPWGLTVYVDEKAPRNCRLDFDACHYDARQMRVMVDRYLRLLGLIPRYSDRPVRTLLDASANPPLLQRLRPAMLARRLAPRSR